MVAESNAREEVENDFREKGTETIARLELLSAADPEEAVADFYEPIRFEWSKSAHRRRQLVTKFSENTHADY